VNTGKGTGQGKVILIGDQFVLFKVSAVLAALPYKTTCTVEIDSSVNGWTLEDNRMEVPGYKDQKKEDQVNSFNTMIEELGINLKKTPLKISLGGDLLAGSGVGASAAGCVAFVRACNESFGMGLNDAGVNYFAWRGEFGYHGLPSGLDNTVSTYGGTILYQLNEDKKKFDTLKLKKPVEVVMGNSGITSNTASLKGFLEEQRETDPILFEKRLKAIRVQVSQLRTALEAGDTDEVGNLMSENHRILIDMGLSHPRLIELCDTAVNLGAPGAKVTGGGRGGYMVALTPGKELQELVAAAFEERGISTIRGVIS